jgi:hypothetical protein
MGTKGELRMESRSFTAKTGLFLDIESVAGFIANTQRRSGEIPWHCGGKTDPWDHVESAMGLSIGGYHEASRLAYEWLAHIQLEDGSWYAAYRQGVPEDVTRDTNMSTYIAVGVLHYYLATGNIGFLRCMWETVRRAIDFALNLQAPGGEVYWAVCPEGAVDRMALLTGSCSIYMSLKCALAIAHQLNYHMPSWKQALVRLGCAIRHKPYLFNMTTSRYAMDWFYPVLCGALTGVGAKKRIGRSWRKFVIDAQGVRCVSDRPWITIAETSELSLALLAMGNRALSQIIFSWIFDRQYEDGSYWCGFTVPGIVVWPEDKSTWTNAAVLMAADALYQLTPSSRLFTHHFWSNYNIYTAC